MAWAAAIPIATAVLGGIGGKSKSKASKKPSRNVILPPSELGGWQRLQEIMDRMKSAPQYHVGASNPYLAQGMQHIMERSGMPTPEGGYGPNPYLQPPPPPEPTPPPAPPITENPKLNPKVKSAPGRRY